MLINLFEGSDIDQTSAAPAECSSTLLGLMRHTEWGGVGGNRWLCFQNASPPVRFCRLLLTRSRKKSPLHIANAWMAASRSFVVMALNWMVSFVSDRT